MDFSHAFYTCTVLHHGEWEIPSMVGKEGELVWCYWCLFPLITIEVYLLKLVLLFKFVWWRNWLLDHILWLLGMYYMFMVLITFPCDYCWEMVVPRCINSHRIEWSKGLRLLVVNAVSAEYSDWRNRPDTRFLCFYIEVFFSFFEFFMPWHLWAPCT